MKRLAILLFILIPSFAFANTQSKAQALYEEGVALYNAGNFQQAIYAFEKADQTVPSGVLEYNIALCYEKMGNQPQAINSYRNYLRRVPDAANKDKVNATILRLEGELREEKAREEAAKGPSYGLLGEPAVEEPPAVEAAPQSTRPGSVEDLNIDEIAESRRAHFGGGTSNVQDPEVAATLSQPDSQGQSGHQRMQTDPFAPQDAAPKKKTPAYKKWWFWAGIGVGVVAAVYILSPGDSVQDQPVASGGATLLRF